jgi:RNA polymerase sigma-70 factor (ECF subfamily)
MLMQHAPPRDTAADLAHEAALVERARSDPDAVAELYDLHIERVYRYILRRVGSHANAEELTAQAFRRVLEGLPRYEWRGLPFGAWLFRIAHNLVVDHHRRGDPSLSLDRLLADGFEPADAYESGPEEALLGQEEADLVWKAVATLPPLQRRALTLRFGRDLSHAEVGVLIGRSEAATKQLIYRAVRTLRAQAGVES